MKATFLLSISKVYYSKPCLCLSLTTRYLCQSKGPRDLEVHRVLPPPSRDVGSPSLGTCQTEPYPPLPPPIAFTAPLVPRPPCPQHSHTGIMADSDDGKASSIPAWQRDAESKNATTDDPQPAQDHLETARRFLEDENVKDQSRDKKVAFLKGKGIEDGDIEKLLGVAEAESTDEVGFSTNIADDC